MGTKKRFGDCVWRGPFDSYEIAVAYAEHMQEKYNLSGSAEVIEKSWGSNWLDENGADLEFALDYKEGIKRNMKPSFPKILKDTTAMDARSKGLFKPITVCTDKVPHKTVAKKRKTAIQK